ncbi:hypothetical protein BV898_14558 [Hypsibius exemplaris]|uniref:Uncharacterized protein n=1 Tax=Hypsibius exemplaris TaxID=2072580 RepID=A0A9X6N909_HYPEX|nr:hypothetical protein BV898_14558 [Hypsibius exemplaris]
MEEPRARKASQSATTNAANAGGGAPSANPVSQASNVFASIAQEGTNLNRGAANLTVMTEDEQPYGCSSANLHRLNSDTTKQLQHNTAIAVPVTGTGTLLFQI